MPRSIPTATLFAIVSFSICLLITCWKPFRFVSDTSATDTCLYVSQDSFYFLLVFSGKSSAPRLTISTLIGWNILETRSHWWSTLFWKDLPTLVQSVIWETNVLFWNNPGQSMEIHGKEEKERGCFFNVMNLIFFHEIIVRDFTRVIFISRPTIDYQASKWNFQRGNKILFIFTKTGTILF